MGAAIWSTNPSTMKSMPAKFFIRFFMNHGLLDIKNRPQWKVIKNGSSEYVKKIYKSLITKTYAGEKEATNFQNTTSNWTPPAVPVKRSQESPGISRTHGRTTSDYSDVQSALRRMNR